MYCVGLTGNIASGKSTVAALFKALGITIISADAESRELTGPNESAFQSIISHFGDRVLLPSGDLDRKLLRSIIFNHSEHRLWLEQLLHPLIRERILQKISQVRSPYCIIEIPLLNNLNGFPYLHRVLLVIAPLELQIKRIRERDNASEAQARAILATQTDNLKRQAFANDLIENDDSLEKLARQVEILHNNYLTLSATN